MSDRPSPDAAPGDPRTARLLRVLDSSRDGFWERDLRTGTSWYSDSFYAMFKLDRRDYQDDRTRINARMHPDDVGAFLAAYEVALRTLQPFDYELRYLDGLDRWRWVRGRGQVFAGDDGQAVFVAGALSDVHERVELRLNLQRMTERFEYASAAAGVGLFERAMESDHIYVSDLLWRVLGYEPDELPSQRSVLLQLTHPDDRERYAAAAASVHPVLARLTIEVRMRHKSGEYRWYRQDAQPRRLPDGQVWVTGAIQDVHEQVMARLSLERQREALEAGIAERTARLQAALAEAEARSAEAARAQAAQSRFLAHMSHEIRTPLSGVLSLTELALRVAEQPAQRRYLEVALQSGQTLRQIIDQVLELSRLEAGPPALADEVFDLADALAETMRSVMPLARGKPVALRYDWLGEQTRVRGDAARFRQILTNLLGNAVKFTDQGSVTLVGELTPVDDAPAWLTARVEDSGPGMTDEQVGRIFDAFMQGDPGLSRRHGGTGLGLTIARGLARQMGGDIDVSSRIGIGSVFTVRVPFVVDRGAKPLPAVPPGHFWILSTDQVGCSWLQARFARAGWTSERYAALSAIVTRARGMAAEARPSLVLLPEGPLYAAAELTVLRSALPEARIFLLVRADWQDLEVEQAARACGMALMVTPLTPADLRVLMTEMPEPAPLPTPRPAAPPAQGDVLVVEDNPVNRLIATELLGALGLSVRHAEDGVAALTACQARAPSLVLMDLQMPVMDGLEATRRLRALQAQGSLPHFPIVALTAHAMGPDREHASAAGMDGYLTKPILLASLHAELCRWLPGLPAL